MSYTSSDRDPVGASGPTGCRDAGLRRARSMTKRIAAATVAAVGLLGFYVGRSLPGHAATSASHSTARSTPATNGSQGSASSASPSSSTGSTQNTQPAQVAPPVQTQLPAHVSTGAS